MDLTVSMGIEPLRFDLRKWTADMELGIYTGEGLPVEGPLVIPNRGEVVPSTATHNKEAEGRTATADGARAAEGLTRHGGRCEDVPGDGRREHGGGQRRPAQCLAERRELRWSGLGRRRRARKDGGGYGVRCEGAHRRRTGAQRRRCRWG
ncbi:hypothetical protein E2562_013819 [Oryza meyeriana var. granulata]|uniref:Uncharacterized protein n=1 Tax=Oryza meyeriana var. granulata TaxID=110450 RepID=A0A6G1F897_9ORYZ|nr:hypothetical protein E2562_013819 [Oryza meyeriana var. granulata]